MVGIHFLQSYHNTLQIPCRSKILLYLTQIPRLMRFCILCRNSRWPPEMAGKQFLGKVAITLCRSKILSHTVSEIKMSFFINAEIQDGHQKWWKTISGKKHHYTLQIPCRSKIFVALARTNSEINSVSRVMQKFNIAAKNGIKNIFGNITRALHRSPVGQKFH